MKDQDLTEIAERLILLGLKKIQATILPLIIGSAPFLSTINEEKTITSYLFGMQMLPVKFHLDGRKSYISDIGVQLNFYLRKIERSPENE